MRRKVAAHVGAVLAMLLHSCGGEERRVIKKNESGYYVLVFFVVLRRVERYEEEGESLLSCVRV